MLIKIVENKVIIENDLYRRVILVSPNGIRTVSLFNKKSNREYMKSDDSAEFQFTLNGKVIISYSPPAVHVLDSNMLKHGQLLRLENINTEKGSSGSEIVKISFLCPPGPARLKVCYEIYPDLPGSSKWLEVESLCAELHLRQVFFEMLHACPGDFADSIFLKHGRYKTSPMFTAASDEDIVQLHNEGLNAGMLIGNGAPGLLRYYMVYPNWPSGISCGYNMSGADFNKFFRQGEIFVSDKAYVCLYENKATSAGVFNTFREMIRRDLPPCRVNFGAMYCTWLPFLKNINEKLLLELADRAATMGFTWFVVDDGWFIDNDWEVDPLKFPHGLQVVSDKVHQLGMKFGLWLNIGTDYGQVGSRQQDNALDYHGETKFFGLGGGNATRCLASKHRNLMTDKLLSLADKYGVDYFKLDFSNICSPYGVMPYGCSSNLHEYHHDFSDSVTEQYLAMMYMRNKVKAQFPETLLDFSFEAFGTEFPSIGALHYSDLHHVSNMDTLQPKILRAEHIRNTLYEYCRMLPNERILGSLICLQKDHDIEHLLTAMVGMPLVAGDLCAITSDGMERIRRVLSAVKNFVGDKPLTRFQTFDNAGSEWDGYARYHHSWNAGIICIFRNKFKGVSVKLILEEVPDGDYFLQDIFNDVKYERYTGMQLRNGIEIELLPNRSFLALICRKSKTVAKTNQKSAANDLKTVKKRK